ncbi:alpha/beta hydrolase [Halosegnis marinus]|uniref:Alpha/beta hydrolase n=1 Tax=Halosegnis marinus TaxID=3034023 RepID=A0ABD5ZN35_9EURY|nr:alpha/beta hydrolase [Halosegnis sp. DT85]
METRSFNGTGDRDLVLVLGWGNRFDHDTVEWLVDRLAGAGYRIHGFQLPTTITDFDAEWLAPVARTAESLAEYRLLTHSTGGLIGEFLPDPGMTVHLSPWWGFHDDLRNPLVSLAMKLPVSTPLLPAGIEAEDLGEHVTDERMREAPDRAAPTFLREAKRAQARLPTFDEQRTSVFYTPEDPVVSAEAIERRVPPRNRVAYEGGHELFASASRTRHIDTVLAALDAGPRALTDERKP